jgi:hypothetical protein
MSTAEQDWFAFGGSRTPCLGAGRPLRSASFAATRPLSVPLARAPAGRPGRRGARWAGWSKSKRVGTPRLRATWTSVRIVPLGRLLHSCEVAAC